MESLKLLSDKCIDTENMFLVLAETSSSLGDLNQLLGQGTTIIRKMGYPLHFLFKSQTFYAYRDNLGFICIILGDN